MRVCPSRKTPKTGRTYKHFSVSALGKANAHALLSLTSVLQVASETVPMSIRRRYHGGRRPSSDDSFLSPTVIPSSALDKPSIMKRYHRRRTCCHTSPRRSPTMITLHDTRFVDWRWWNDGWTEKTVVTWRSSASMIPAPR